MVKRSAVAPEMLVHEGPARVFDSEDEAIKAIYDGKIEDGETEENEKIDISDINIEDLSDKATEEIEQLEDINMAEGILEIHMDGYGFLRQDNYQSGDDDVYISPSQIRRFRLQTGDKITGVTRPPKSGEKFKALFNLSFLLGLLKSCGRASSEKIILNKLALIIVASIPR